jgi:hypothetical protein
MSAIDPAAVFELHIARSNMIDAYNDADLAVRTRMKALGGTEKSLLGDNLQALEKMQPGPQYAKNEKKRIDELIAELRELQTVRCDVVHSRMQSIVVDGTPCGLFANVQKCLSVGRRGLILSRKELEDCAARLETIAKQIARAPLPPVVLEK